jgi:pimeloyl-ACP methyl ester carboxylesterase
MGIVWSEFTVVRDGVRLVGRDYGEPGPVVVLLHGLAGHCGEWDAAAGWLREGHRVVTLDQRGHGLSERHPADTSRSAYVNDVVAVVEVLGSSPVILVGQSLGGHTAMLVAAARPDLIRALILVEAAPGDPDPGSPARIGRWLDTWPLPFASHAAAAEFFGGGPAGLGWADGLEPRVDGWHARFDRDVMVASLKENAARPFWTEWGQVRCPTLVVLAEHGIIPPQDVERMTRQRPSTTVVRVPATGHDLHLEDLTSLRTALEAFLLTI